MVTDRISDLPDVLLHEVLSYLPSIEAVRTCVLAPRWRTLWKSVPALIITGDQHESVHSMNKFVNNLLLLREPVPLRECHISSYKTDLLDDHEAVELCLINNLLLLRYAVLCKARELCLRAPCDDYDYDHLKLFNMTVIFQHLTSLQLYNVDLQPPVDFLSCLALEDLEIEFCDINLCSAFPKSLRRLRIKDSSLSWIEHTRPSILATGLVILQLDACLGFAPSLETMPSLVKAYIRFDAIYCYDHCKNFSYLGDCGDDDCLGCYDLEDRDADYCVLLNGLSSATNLELISDPFVFLFRNDFKWCLMFSKLKTLLLNDWCLTANFSGLVYFLQYSPVLERLTLQLSFEELSDLETGESYNPTKQFLVSKHLKVVEIKCCRKAEIKCCYITKILVTHGVPLEKISIQPNFFPIQLNRFSFELKE